MNDIRKMRFNVRRKNKTRLACGEIRKKRKEYLLKLGKCNLCGRRFFLRIVYIVRRLLGLRT